MALVALPFGLAIGVAVGMLGGGGSVLAVPVLVYVLGLGVHEAATTSLVVVTAGALAGGLRHACAGHVCWRHAGAFTAAALPGVIAGTALGNAVSGRALIGTFVVIMLLAAVATWRKAGDAADDAGPCEPACPPLQLARDMTAGLLIGAMTGFFGIGGGFLVVPVLALFLALSMRLAIGTSLAIIAATSVMGVVAHLLAGRDVDVGITGAMTIGCIAGALAGAALAGRVPQRRLGRGFALLVAATAAYLVISVVALNGPPGS